MRCPPHEEHIFEQQLLFCSVRFVPSSFSVPYLETGVTIAVATREGTISPVAFLGAPCAYSTACHIPSQSLSSRIEPIGFALLYCTYSYVYVILFGFGCRAVRRDLLVPDSARVRERELVLRVPLRPRRRTLPARRRRR